MAFVPAALSLHAAVLLAWLLLVGYTRGSESFDGASMEKRRQLFQTAGMETVLHHDSRRNKQRHLAELPKESSPADASASVAAERVINGAPANFSNYRWFARLTYRVNGTISYWDDQGDSCGGVLISDRIVLTAAHCVWNMTHGGRRRSHGGGGGLRNDLYGAAVGVVCDAPDNCGWEFVSLRGQNYWVPPYWDPSKFVLDLALVRLAQNVPQTVAVPAIPDLYDYYNHLSFGYGDNLRTVGYGWINDTAMSIPPTQLQELTVGHMPAKHCEQFWGRLYDAVVCVYTNDEEEGVFGRGLCKGDSGSPTVLRQSFDGGDDGPDIVIGITSFGSFPCTAKNRPDVLARVSAAAPYITKVVCCPGSSDTPPKWCPSSVLDNIHPYPNPFWYLEAKDYNVESIFEPTDLLAIGMTECTKENDSMTRYHSNQVKNPEKTKPCRGLAKKSKREQQKACTSFLKSSAGRDCCNSCPRYYPSVRSYYS